MKKAISLLSAMLLGISAVPAAVSAESIDSVVYEMGDVNHDGYVDALDACLTLRYFTISISTPNGISLDDPDCPQEILEKLQSPYFDHIKENGDINGDGIIDVTDATTILRIYTEKLGGDPNNKYDAGRYLIDNGYNV